MTVLPVQQTDEDVDGGDVCDCGSNVATIGVVVTLIIDPTRSGVAELLQLMLLLMLLLLLLRLSLPRLRRLLLHHGLRMLQLQGLRLLHGLRVVVVNDSLLNW